MSRNVSTSPFSRLLSPDSERAGASTCIDAEPISPAPRAPNFLELLRSRRSNPDEACSATSNQDTILQLDRGISGDTGKWKLWRAADG